MANDSANLTSFAGRLLTPRQLTVLTELIKYTKPVSVTEIYDDLAKKIPDNHLASVLDTLSTGTPPLVTRLVKRRLYMGNEILAELWVLSDQSKKFIDRTQ